MGLRNYFSRAEGLRLPPALLVRLNGLFCRWLRLERCPECGARRDDGGIGHRPGCLLYSTAGRFQAATGRYLDRYLDQLDRDGRIMDAMGCEEYDPVEVPQPAPERPAPGRPAPVGGRPQLVPKPRASPQQEEELAEVLASLGCTKGKARKAAQDACATGKTGDDLLRDAISRAR